MSLTADPATVGAAGNATLLRVCVTCGRYAGQNAKLGEELAAALETALGGRFDCTDVMLRRVSCLSGCKQPGNVMFGRMGEAKTRIHNLAIGETDALLDLVVASASTPGGDRCSTAKFDGRKFTVRA